MLTRPLRAYSTAVDIGASLTSPVWTGKNKLRGARVADLDVARLDARLTVVPEMARVSTRVALALAVAAFAVCGGGSGAATPAPSPIAGAPETVIAASEMRFNPGEVKLPGAALNLTLRDDGRLPHDLTIADLGVYLVVQSGEKVTAGFHDLTKGVYHAYCGIQGHRDAGMQIDVIAELRRPDLQSVPGTSRLIIDFAKYFARHDPREHRFPRRVSCPFCSARSGRLTHLPTAGASPRLRRNHPGADTSRCAGDASGPLAPGAEPVGGPPAMRGLAPRSPCARPGSPRP